MNSRRASRADKRGHTRAAPWTSRDFNRLAANVGATGARWDDGDFNYDGVVDLLDFNCLAANFGQSASGSVVTPADWATLASAVPEPGAASGVVFTLVFASRRRRRG